MSDDRILELTNDMSKCVYGGSRSEWIEVARYWRDRCDEWNNLHQKRMMELTLILAEHAAQPHP